jgi:hypothetical protein
MPLTTVDNDGSSCLHSMQRSTTSHHVRSARERVRACVRWPLRRPAGRNHRRARATVCRQGGNGNGCSWYQLVVVACSSHAFIFSARRSRAALAITPTLRLESYKNLKPGVPASSSSRSAVPVTSAWHAWRGVRTHLVHRGSSRCALHACICICHVWLALHSYSDAPPVTESTRRRRRRRSSVVQHRVPRYGQAKDAMPLDLTHGHTHPRTLSIAFGCLQALEARRKSLNDRHSRWDSVGYVLTVYQSPLY